MKFKYDKEADAVYIYLSEKPYAYGKDLDDERRIDYAHDNTPIGVELLCVSHGVNVASLPHESEITEALAANGIMAYRITKGTKSYAMEQDVVTWWQEDPSVVFGELAPIQGPSHTAELHEVKATRG